MGNMYSGVKTWSPFVGCLFSCSYCASSFKRQMKRQRKNCNKCYKFEPHFHPERLEKPIPSAPIIWPCAYGDISFCPLSIITDIACKTRNHYNNTFYWQSKNPLIFKHLIIYLHGCEANHVLLTTLETNRDKDYRLISQAPYPTDRAYDFAQIKWPRKIVTIEPILDFDHDEFLRMIMEIKPEAVYIGYESKRRVKLPELPIEKTLKLIAAIEAAGITVKQKFMLVKI